MNEVNEGSTAYLTVTFLDKNGAPQAPTSATWQAHDVATGTVLQAATAISVASQVEITLPPAIQAIQDVAREWEAHRITIKALYGASDAVNDEFDYRVNNLSWVP